MAIVYLIRHGQTDWNVDCRVMGREDVPLNQVGQKQANELDHLMKDFEIHEIYSSPQLRAKQTAEKLAQRRKLSIETEPALAEVDYRNWVGKTFDELQKDPAYQTYHNDPEIEKHEAFESVKEVKKRTSIFVEQLVKKNPDGRFALVSHADPIRIMLNHMMAQPLREFRRFRVANAAITAVEYANSRWILTLLNHRNDPETVILQFAGRNHGQKR